MPCTFLDTSQNRIAPNSKTIDSSHRPWRLVNPSDTGPFDKVLDSIDKWLNRITVAGIFIDVLLGGAGLPGRQELFLLTLLWLVVPLFFGVLVAIGKHFHIVGAHACESKPLLRDDEESDEIAMRKQLSIIRPLSDFERAGTVSAGGKKIDELANISEEDSTPAIASRGKQSFMIKGRGIVKYWIEGDSVGF
jgi:hypothetical protein